jgi:hypothetical protein
VVSTAWGASVTITKGWFGDDSGEFDGDGLGLTVLISVDAAERCIAVC